MPSDDLSARSTPSGEFYVPKEKYVGMTAQDRSKVYKSTKEALAGDLSKASLESLAKKAWDDIANPSLNYSLKKKASDLKGMPVSQAILEAFTQAKKGNAEALGKRTPRQVMFYCLDYLQNKEKMPNIDLVKRDEYVEVYKEASTQRWKLRVTNDKGEVQRGMDSYLFPPATRVSKAVLSGTVTAGRKDPDEEGVKPGEKVAAKAPEGINRSPLVIEKLNKDWEDLKDQLPKSYSSFGLDWGFSGNNYWDRKIELGKGGKKVVVELAVSNENLNTQDLLDYGYKSSKLDLFYNETPEKPEAKKKALTENLIILLDDLVGRNFSVKVEEPKVEEPKVEEPKVEEPKVEEPKVEDPKVEDLKVEDLKVEDLKVEDPKVEDPKVEDPKVEDPKVEDPKVEEPKAEEPKAEEPKAEEPKAEEPKAEEPKAEELKESSYVRMLKLEGECMSILTGYSKQPFTAYRSSTGGLTVAREGSDYKGNYTVNLNVNGEARSLALSVVVSSTELIEEGTDAQFSRDADLFQKVKDALPQWLERENENLIVEDGLLQDISQLKEQSLEIINTYSPLKDYLVGEQVAFQSLGLSGNSYYGFLHVYLKVNGKKLDLSFGEALPMAKVNIPASATPIQTARLIKKMLWAKAQKSLSENLEMSNDKLRQELEKEEARKNREKELKKLVADLGEGSVELDNPALSEKEEKAEEGGLDEEAPILIEGEPKDVPEAVDDKGEDEDLERPVHFDDSESVLPEASVVLDHFTEKTNYYEFGYQGQTFHIMKNVTPYDVPAPSPAPGRYTWVSPEDAQLVRTLFGAAQLRVAAIDKKGGFVRTNVEGKFIDPETGEVIEVKPGSTNKPSVITLFKKIEKPK